LVFISHFGMLNARKIWQPCLIRAANFGSKSMLAMT
jgi:hypothetical protein